MHTVFLEFELGDHSATVYESLKPELEAVPSERSKVNMSVQEGRLNLFITADDIISLRAAVNTWLRLVKIAEEMLNTKVTS